MAGWSKESALFVLDELVEACLKAARREAGKTRTIGQETRRGIDRLLEKDGQLAGMMKRFQAWKY